MSKFLSRFRHLAASAQAAEDEERREDEEARAAEEEEENSAEEEEREDQAEEEDEESELAADEDEEDLEEEEEETKATRAARRRERARCAAILGAREAAGRVPMACSLAFDTGLSPKAARKILASAPKESSGQGSRLSSAMRQVGNPKVGPGGGAAEPRDAAALAAQVISVHRGQRRGAGKEG